MVQRVWKTRKRNSSSGGRAEGMVERPQGHTFGDPLPSSGWVPCLQHMSLGGSTAYANQNTGYLALQPRTVDSGGQPQAGPANRGIEVCSWLLCSEIPSFIPHLFPHPQSRDSDCLSSHLSQDFLNHSPCTDPVQNVQAWESQLPILPSPYLTHYPPCPALPGTWD